MRKQVPAGVPEEILDLVLALVLPGEPSVQPVRMADPASGIKTALVRTYQRFAADHAVDPNTLALGCGFAICRASFLHALTRTLTSTPAANTVYFVKSTGGIAVPNGSTTFVVNCGENAPLPMLMIDYSDANIPNQWAWTLSGKQEEPRIMWFDAGTFTFTITPSGTFVSGMASVKVEQFDGKAFVPVAATPRAFSSTAANTITVSSATAGYYKFAASWIAHGTSGVLDANSAASSASFALSHLPSSGVLVVHQPMFEYDKIAPGVDAMKVTTSSLLYTNTTPGLGRGGEIAGYQSAPGQAWTHILCQNNILVKDPYSVVSVQSGAVSLDGSTGMYASTRPTSTIQMYSFVEDFSVSTSSDGSIQGICDSYGALVSPSIPENFVAWNMSAELNDAVNAAPSAVLTHDAVCEYTTDLQCIEKRLASHSVEELQAAVAVTRGMPVFTENPTHKLVAVKAAKQGIMEILRGVGDVYKQARDTISTVSPRFSSLLDGVLGTEWRTHPLAPRGIRQRAIRDILGS